MNSPNFDNSGDGESWDGKGELEWTEQSWKQFLKDADAEVGRFIKTYQGLKSDPQRLDKTAMVMGWDSEEWSSDFDKEEDEKQDWSSSSSEDDYEDFEDMDDGDPYTIHKHPLYVTTRSFYVLLSYYWKVIALEHSEAMTVIDAHKFGDSVRVGETNSIMGTHALEMGDYNLVVCHLQRSLQALNETMTCFQNTISKEDHSIEKSMESEFFACSFDLREAWLRVIKECRNLSDFR